MWIAKGINVVRISNNAYANSTANMQTIAGIGWQLPIQKFIIDPGVTVQDLVIPDGTTHGYVELEVNGDIVGTGAIGDYPVTSTNHSTVKITGAGNIGPRKVQKFTLAVGGSGVRQNMLGGFGGASAPDFRYQPLYGNAFATHLTRPSTNNFNIEWTYNEADYVNLGPGNANINATSIITDYIDASGNITVGTTKESYQIGLGCRRRDCREVTVATGPINGQRYWWILSNTKANWGVYVDFNYSANSFKYYMNGWAPGFTILTPSNANLSTAAGGEVDENPLDGSFNTVPFNGTIQGI